MGALRQKRVLKPSDGRRLMFWEEVEGPMLFVLENAYLLPFRRRWRTIIVLSELGFEPTTPGTSSSCESLAESLSIPQVEAGEC